MAAKRGLKTVAILNEDTLFTKASAVGVAEIAKKKGRQLVFQEAYPKGNTDFSALLTKLKAANSDVIAASTYFDDAVALTRQMRELNVSAKMYGVTVGGDLPKFYDLLKAKRLTWRCGTGIMPGSWPKTCAPCTMPTAGGT